MAAILDDGGSDLGNLGDLMARGLGVVATEVVAAPRAGGRLALDDAGELFGCGTSGRMKRLRPCWPPRFLPEGVSGGRRL